ncbi:uncharacterized protein LOC132293161 [Cornus florida]|uniref:uncharacterized protein LOC132293161 n=1 Tax=Cornus florida TaxID=4283 RepID=UPI00289EC06F|nr:uncharacterized protein LOC132293161 [Cornus florida]
MATKNQASSSNGNCESDCKEIHDSWGRLSHLVRALASRNQPERREIRKTYMAMYGEDLINRFKEAQMSSQSSDRSGFSSKIFAAMSMWMLDPIERDAVVARDALEQSDINYKALVEILACRKSSHVLLIKQAYHTRFKRQLDQDIISIEPPHPFQRILVAMAASHSAHHAEVSHCIAKYDARRLYQTGEGRAGAIDEAVVLELLSKRSIPQLKLTFLSYKHIYGHDYSQSLKNGNYGEFEDALKAVVKCIYNSPKYLAKTLYASIKGITADNGGLARVMVSRAEVDMDEIQGVFKKKYGMELKDSICESISSGDYTDFLVALATRAGTTVSS